MKDRTRAYWATRILLAIGLVATVIMLALTSMALTADLMYEPPPFVLGLPVGKVIALAGLASALVGFAWMVRIFRGPREEPPVWRYRDR